MQKSRNSKIQKIKTQNILSIVFMSVVCLGAAGVGACLVMSEVLYPQTDELWECPAWYQAVIYVSLAVAVGGIVGCAFTKNRRNTSKTECNIELALFWGGFVLDAVCAIIRTESRVLDIFIGIGGAISSVGFFCWIGSSTGQIKKLRDVYVDIYRDLITYGQLYYDKFPKSKPAPLLDVIEVEKYFNTPLPAELVDFLLEFNGDGDLLFSANEIIDTTQSVRETFKAFGGADKFCCFGGDGAGNYFCYKISDNGRIEDGGIYLWNHETNEATLVAATLPELIKKYYNGETKP